MATLIIMPRQGQSVESCIITKWNKAPGDRVEEGELLFSYETDKATFDEVAKVSGQLLVRFAKEGDDVPCLDRVAVIGEPGEDISEFEAGEKGPDKAGSSEDAAPSNQGPAGAAEATPVSGPAGAAGATPVSDPAGAASAAGNIGVSPRAKAFAQNRQLDLEEIPGTGPGGRIIERDVIDFSKGQADLEAVKAEETRGNQATVNGKFKPFELAKATDITGGPYEDLALSNVRKAIAKAMHSSIAGMAQLTHSFSFDATAIMEYRKLIKAGGQELDLENITYNDMVLYAVSRVLKNHRDLNTHFLDGKMRYFERINLGMAVDTPRGLLVPTIFGADKLSLNEIAAEAKFLAKQAQSGTISPDYLQNGSFTISNLGAFGVEHFTPVINPPQTGILGVNNIQVKWRMKDGQPEAYQAMGLSLTYDHRAVDGAPASRFVQELCKTLENFTALLAK